MKEKIYNYVTENEPVHIDELVEKFDVNPPVKGSVKDPEFTPLIKNDRLATRQGREKTDRFVVERETIVCRYCHSIDMEYKGAKLRNSGGKICLDRYHKCQNCDELIREFTMECDIDKEYNSSWAWLPKDFDSDRESQE